MISLLLAAVLSAPTYGDVTSGIEVIAIHDGDTFTATIANWPAVIGERIKVRISGIDAPEMTSKDQATKEKAQAAKQRLVGLLRGTPDKRPRIVLRELRRDKYFRLLCRVEADGVDLGSLLIREGLARAYDGGHK